MITYVTIKGLVRDGKLEVELPPDLVDGEAVVTVMITATAPADTLSDEEWREAFNFQGGTLGEILASELVGVGADWDIGDSAEWVDHRRRTQAEEAIKKWMDS
jgi:hypothetical protein